MVCIRLEGGVWFALGWRAGCGLHWAGGRGVVCIGLEGGVWFALGWREGVVCIKEGRWKEWWAV